MNLFPFNKRIFLRISSYYVWFIFISFHSVAQNPTIKDVKPSELCIGETIKIEGKNLLDITRIVFKDIELWLSNGEFLIENETTIFFTVPDEAVTDGKEIITTIVYTGIQGNIFGDDKDKKMIISSLPEDATNPTGSSYCEGEHITPVSVDDPGDGFKIEWFDAAVDGRKVGDGIQFTPDEPGTYFAEVINTTTKCRSASRVSGTVVENPAPNIPTGPTGSSYCEGESVSSVSVEDPGTGFRIDWYDDDHDGILLGSGSYLYPCRPRKILCGISWHIHRMF